MLIFNLDLVSFIVGVNDVLKGCWNYDVYKNDMEFMIDILSKVGVDIIIVNFLDFIVRFFFVFEKK